MEKLKNVEIKEDIPELFQEDIHSFENQDIMEEDTPLELEIQEEYKQYSKITGYFNITPNYFTS